MPAIRRLSVAEQTANHLRESLQEGRWQEGLPGVRRLAQELGVSHDSVRLALRQLEREGWVASQGEGRSRGAASAGRRGRRSVRVAVLLQVPLYAQNGEMQRTLVHLRHELEAAGHICVFARKSQDELGGDPRRIARLVAETRADAWVLVAGTREVIEWFSSRALPSIGFGGRTLEFPIPTAGMDLVPALEAAVRHLLQFGHRRIVLIGPRAWRQPSPSRIVRAFCEALQSGGVAPGEYHAPDWDETPDGLHGLLESLFRLTPPTALLVVEPPRFTAVLQFLGVRQLRVPQDVSLICLGQDPMFDWCKPPIASLRYDLGQPERCILRWVEEVAAGRPGGGQVLFPVEFDPGGSIGPPPQE